MTLPVTLHKAVSTDSRGHQIQPSSIPFCSQRACFTENPSERIHPIAGHWHALYLVSSSRFLRDTLCHICYSLHWGNRMVSVPLTYCGLSVLCVTDLMVEFMVSHMAKNFRLDLYRFVLTSNPPSPLTSLPLPSLPVTPRRCLGVVHRMLCYQKRCKIRLNYGWKELWVGRSCTQYHCMSLRVCPFYITAALLNLLKFFATSEEHLLPKFNIFIPAIEVRSLLLYTVYFTPIPGDTGGENIQPLHHIWGHLPTQPQYI